MSLNKTIVHLLSGGLDSVTMLYDLKKQGHNIHCLLFDYEQKHSQELDLAEYHANACQLMFTTIQLPDLGGLTEKSWIVPNRNCIMLGLAVNLAVRAGADTVTIGCNKDDEAAFPDCRMAFIQLFNTMLTTTETPVEVCAPYIDWPKWKIVAQARNLGVPLDKIWTCYQPTETGPCGTCAACVKLEKAFNVEHIRNDMRPC